MNENKICFISCVNDDVFYKECLLYINQLYIPEGYEVEHRYVKGAQSMLSGYNKLMNQSDAKYKVYLHQDTFIINKNFIYDILAIFESNKNIGLIGMCGAEVLPTNAVWWEALNKYGKVYESHTGVLKELSFNSYDYEFAQVQAVDGYLMVTQYDLEWNESVFEGWHFYDISQSTEFRLAGYDIVVPKQVKPWCIHDCGLVDVGDDYDKARLKFLDYYSKEIYPLVSIIIPTFNRPELLVYSIESALNQSYKHIELLVGDDSTNRETAHFMKKYVNDQRVIYIDNKGPLGEFGHNNIENLYEKSRGDYINILMDDDMFDPLKIEKMMNYYIQDFDIALVTSARQMIDYEGRLLDDIYATKPISENTVVLDGQEVGKLLLESDINFIGEPTTALVNKKHIKPMYGRYLDRQYKVMIDVAQWLTCCKQGKVVYISEKLSYFRSHPTQNQKKPEIIAGCLIDKFNYTFDSYKEKYFIDEDVYQKIKLRLLNDIDHLSSIWNYISSEKQIIIESIKEALMA